MANVLVNENSLTGIANAIRGKNGSTDTYKPSEMAAAITAISGGGPDIPDSAFVISGNYSYWDYNGKWDVFIDAYKNKWSTSDITDGNFMFSGSVLSEILFDINFSLSTSFNINTASMFSYCKNITKIPKLNNLKVYNISSLFNSCSSLRTISQDVADNWNWSLLESLTTGTYGRQSSMFYNCSSLRTIPLNLIKSGNPYINYSYSYFYNGFYYCRSLDELINLPIPYTKGKWTNNAFISTFVECNRFKNVTFVKQEDGAPITVDWKNQVIDLSNFVGYTFNKDNIINNNSGITADKEVTDDATYAALKDDADWFTCNVAYSRYNHDSAVATINSLPDTSAYLATAGGTNTIKFKGEAGSATDGGAINTLTEEEIAVATAKGWTVTLI